MKHLKCPHCRRHLLEPMQYPLSNSDATCEVDACLHCGGLWLDNGEIETIIKAHDPEYPVDQILVEKLGTREKETQLRCPRCHTNLNSHTVSKASKLELDVCQKCRGIWLEQGELEHAQVIRKIPSAVEAIERDTTWGNWLFQFFIGLPVEFNIKPRKFPVVTVTLLLLNIVAFCFAGPFSNTKLFRDFALYPSQMGLPMWFLALITYQFLHIGPMHIIGNMYFLYILGDNVEDVLGRGRYLAFYLFCGVMAGIAQTVSSYNSPIPIVGASGSIAGVMAAYAVIFRHAKLTFMLFFWQFKLSTFWYFGIWIAFNVAGILLNGIGVAWFAHLGGFGAGLVISLRLYNRILEQRPLLKYMATKKI